MMTLTEKVKLYYMLDKQTKMQLKKMETLSKEIKESILDDQEKIIPGTYSVGIDDYDVQVQVKKQKPKVDEGSLEQLLVDKNLWGEGTRRQVDHDLISQLFIEGKLTDNDMRSISDGSDIVVALKVDKTDV